MNPGSTLRARLPCIVLLVAVLAGGVAVPAHGQRVFMEREYKLDVPMQTVDEVWEYLQGRYGGEDVFPGKPGSFAARFSAEHFIDRYFDTPELDLLHAHGGVRYRQRFVPDDHEDARHGRERIQVKLDRPGEEGMVVRTEVTFSVRGGTTVQTPDDMHPLLSLVPRSDRDSFRDVMQEVGIHAVQLQPTLTLDQRRRRMYLERDGDFWAQFSLDEIESRKWWRTVRYALIEIALDEAAYSNATMEQRDLMERVQQEMMEDLLAAFPSLTVDLTPKYNRTFDELGARFLFFPTAIRFGMPAEFILAIVAAGLIGAALLMRRRLRRARLTPA